MRVFAHSPLGALTTRFLALFVGVLSSSLLFAKFEQTTGTKVDSKVFGGMSDEEVERLAGDLSALNNEYISSINKNIKKFDEGDKSSKFGGNGRYGGYGEAHVTKGDGMVAHEGGANAAEGSIERGAFGTTGLRGQARIDAEKKIMEERTSKLDQPVFVDGKLYTHRNKLTGQMQTQSFEISAVLYDAGPAHGDGNDPHRVYGVKAEVRTESNKNGKVYADKTIQDATLAPGKQPNLDLLHKSFSKMEQDKYIMMASDAFAFRSARLDGTDTTKSESRNTVGEYKQIAVDAYAAYPGDIKKAEAEIGKKLAQRVAEKKVIQDEKLCPDGTVGKCKPSSGAAQAQSEKLTPDQAAQKILARLGASQDGTNIEAIKEQITKGVAFQKDQNGAFTASDVFVDDLMQKVSLRSLSGVLSSSQLETLYGQAKQNLDPDRQAKIGEYQQRLLSKSNDCFSFTSFCYSSKFGSIDPNKKQVEGANGSASIDKDDPNEFQKISGDPGAYFKDTREFIFNKFAYAYNRPLSEWKGIVTNLDFNKNTDKNIKDVGTYKEFSDMYDNAMKNAQAIQQNADKNLIDRLKSAGATPEQIAKVRKNYSVNFDPKKLTHMQLFGQNKDRDAVMMDWRKSTDNKFYNPTVRQKPSAAPAQKNPLSNPRPNTTRTPGLI
ncbi:MAG: hypothetical protein R3A80_00985 [Bdellovibrionota bacterium]